MIDLEKADRYYAVGAFNNTWEYFDKTDRQPQETLMMIHGCHASLWHWVRTPEHTADNVNIGLWQLSRAYALAARDTGDTGFGSFALKYAQQTLDHAERNGLDAFYLAYAHEAIGRAHMVLRETAQALPHLERAESLVEGIIDQESRDLVCQDLSDLRQSL